MRWVVSGLCLVGALLLIAASILMNWTFWTGQGADAQSSRALGVVSIGVDIFKATLPLIIAWAWRERLRLGVVIGIAFFVGCLSFSFLSAIGFAATSRGSVTANHEAVSERYTSLHVEERDLRNRLAKLNAPRPRSVIDEALARAQQDRRWESSKRCAEPTVEASRSYCRDIGDLKIELASSLEADGASQRLATVQVEINRLTIAGATHDKDIQAGILARLSGLKIDSVQTALSLLAAVIVEIGAAFGLFLAILPFGRKGGGDNGTRGGPPTPLIPSSDTSLRRIGGPKKFVRAPDGQLQIE